MYKISLIIPIYNVENYIEECIYSVIKQLNPEIEVICINDGTPDASMHIVRSIIACLSIEEQNQFKLIEQQNGGLSNARNTGIANATGSYIAFLDSDDTIEPEYFETILKALKNTNLDILDFNLINSESKVIKSSNGNIQSAFNYMNWYMPARIINRKLFEQFHFTENIHYEDLDLMPKMYIAAKNIVHIDKPLYYYRTNQSSITRTINHTNNSKSIQSLEYILNRYIDLHKKYSNSFYGIVVIQSYFMLTIQYYKAEGLTMALKHVDRYHKKIKQAVKYKKLSIDYSIIDKKILFFYFSPNIYLKLYNLYTTKM